MRVAQWIVGLTAAMCGIAPCAFTQVARLDRVPTQALMGQPPGVAVIRDSVSWQTLWTRYSGVAYVDTSRVEFTAPHVDFRRHMLVAVALGSFSDCSNSAKYVRRVEYSQDSIIVVVGPAYDERVRLTCMMIVNPVDVVRLPRSRKPVTFRPLDPHMGLPQRAQWWSHPSAAQLREMSNAEIAALASPLVRDPTTSIASLEILARRRALSGEVLRRADVRANRPLVTLLAQQSTVVGRGAAGQLLFERFGHALARNHSTPADQLSILMEQLPSDRWTAAQAEIGKLLWRHPVVRTDRKLLADYIGRSQKQGQLHEDACDLYMRQWSPWTRIRNTYGEETTSWSSILCPRVPPPPPL